MIKIPIDIAVSIYLGISIIILLCWFLSERKKIIKISNSETENLWECPYCFHIYINSKSKDISKCPKCLSLHKKEEKL